MVLPVETAAFTLAAESADAVAQLAQLSPEFTSFNELTWLRTLFLQARPGHDVFLSILEYIWDHKDVVHSAPALSPFLSLATSMSWQKCCPQAALAITDALLSHSEQAADGYHQVPSWDDDLSMWARLLRNRAALVRLCSEGVPPSSSKDALEQLVRLSYSRSTLALLSSCQSAVDLMSDDADLLLRESYLHPDVGVRRLDEDILLMFRVLRRLVTHFIALHDRGDADPPSSAVDDTDHVIATCCGDVGARPCQQFREEQIYGGDGVTEEDSAARWCQKCRVRVERLCKILSGSDNLNPDLRLELLENAYALLYVRVSDIHPMDGNSDVCATVVSSIHEAAPLLTLQTQMALVRALLHRLERHRTDTIDGSTIARADRLYGRLDEYHRRLHVIQPLVTSHLLMTSLLHAAPEQLLARCWRPRRLALALDICQAYSCCKSREFVRLSAEMRLMAGLQKLRHRLKQDDERCDLHRDSVAIGTDTDGLPIRGDCAGTAHLEQQVSVDENHVDSRSCISEHPDWREEADDKASMIKTIRGLASRAMSSETVLAQITTLLEDSSADHINSDCSNPLLNTSMAVMYELLLTGSGRADFISATASVQDVLISGLRPGSVHSLVTTVRRWLHSCQDDQLLWFPDLPRGGATSVQDVLFSSVPLCVKDVDRKTRHWRRLADIMTTAPPSGPVLKKISAVLHKLGDGPAGPTSDYVMSLWQYLKKLHLAVRGTQSDDTSDVLSLLRVRPSELLADQLLLSPSPEQLVSAAVRLKLDPSCLMMSRLWPTLGVRYRRSGASEDACPGSAQFKQLICAAVDSDVDRDTSVTEDAVSLLSTDGSDDVQSADASCRLLLDDPIHSVTDTSSSDADLSLRHSDLAGGGLTRLLTLVTSPEVVTCLQQQPPTPRPPAVAAPCPTPASLALLLRQNPPLHDLHELLLRDDTTTGRWQCVLRASAGGEGSVLPALNAELQARDRLQYALQHGDWQEARSVLDTITHLTGMSQCRDAVILLQIAHSDGDGSWVQVQQIQDARLRGRVTALLCRDWPIKRCLDALSACHDQSELVDRLLLCRELTMLWKQCGLPCVGGWRSLERRCRRSPRLVAHLLFQHGRPSALRGRWCRLHGHTHTDTQPSAAELWTYMQQHQLAPVTRTRQLLCELDPVTVVGVADRLTSVESRLLVLTGLCRHQSRHMPEQLFRQLVARVAALRLLQLLGKQQHEYAHLEHRPELIVLQLVVNHRYQVAAVAMDVLYDSGLLSSARIQQPGRRPPPVPLAQSVPPLDPLLNAAVAQLADRALIAGGGTARTPPAVGAPLPRQLRRPSAVAQHRWQPDSTATRCQRCSAAFTTRNRRHHCRRCGRLVCDACSRQRLVLEGAGDTAVRVCAVCVAMCEWVVLSNQEDHQDDVTSPSRRQPVECAVRIPAAADNADLRATLSAVQFPHTPSVSTCLMLLGLHTRRSQCVQQLLDSSRRLLDPAAAADPALRCAMARQLALAAKLLSASGSADSSCSADTELLERASGSCDAVLHTVAVWRQLVAAGCPELVSCSGVQLVAELVRRQLWTAALDVCTKTSGDPAAVWSAWGLACLRAGRWRQARDKLQRALCGQTGGGGTADTPSPLLLTVVNTLQQQTAVCEVDGADIISSAAASISSILRGDLSAVLPPASPAAAAAQLDECLFYLREYGSRRHVLRFLQRRRLYRRALTECQQLSTVAAAADFHSCLLLPALRHGQLQLLLDEMQPLQLWSEYLLYSCNQLRRTAAWNTLLQLQLICGDRLRAASSCIRLFCSHSTYMAYAQAIHHLHSAQSYLHSYLSSTDWHSDSTDNPALSSSGAESLRLVLPWKQVSFQLAIVEQQIQVTRFLTGWTGTAAPSIDSPPATTSAPPADSKFGSGTHRAPTLFGGQEERRRLALLLLTAPGDAVEALCVVHRLDGVLRVSLDSVLPAVATQLLAADRSEQLHKLLVQLLETEQLAAATLLQLSDILPPDHPSVHQLLAAIQDPEIRILASMRCGQLKTVFLWAARRQRTDLVTQVMSRSIERGQHQVTTVCRRWLLKRAPNLLQ